jgi:hypothetical protein
MIGQVKDVFEQAIKEKSEMSFKFYINKKLKKKERKHNEFIMSILSYLDEDTDFGIKVGDINEQEGTTTFTINSDAVEYIYNEIKNNK